jgi:hypothetical protein
VYGIEQTKQEKQSQGERRDAYSGISIETFKNLIIPPSVMRDGILFVWAEKELIGEIVLHFEDQGF